ncbi:T9SS type A sorting domain-containing protein [Roseivirga sp. BDSF3-8]|uniref:T9SS type A sorting domain-containing protein n=1 Tax=Roseivirga sp. BDSF3-8 TaxID=3241598 RepID=UPI00353221CE
MTTNKLRHLILTLFCLLPLALLAQDYEILRVENVRDGWNKLKMGNNPSSFWNPKVDVTAGGNTHLELEFRISEGTPDLSRLQIRPNGYGGNPIKLADYVPVDFTYGFEWYTISIPLANFDTGIDFSQLNLLQIPYSNNAGLFVMEIRSVTFTGGATPYVWFGEGKRDNIHDGFGNSGQLIAAIEKEFYFQYDYSYPGRVEVAYYNEATEGYYLVDSCQIPQVSCIQDDENRPVEFLDPVVSNCEFISGTHNIQATLKDGSLVSESFVIPSLEPLGLVSADLTPPTDTIDGNIEVTVKGGRAPYFFRQQGSFVYQRSEGLFNETVDPFQWSYNPLYSYTATGHFPDLQVDLYENVYVQSGETIEKLDKYGVKLWDLHISNGFIYQLYVDPNGTLYVSGMAETGFNLEGRHLGVDTVTSFIARINANGQLEWLRNIGTDRVIAINSDRKGSLYLLTESIRLLKMGINGVLNYNILLNTDYEFLRAFGKIAFDDKGNIFAASSSGLYSPTTVLSKITEDGNVIFSKRLEGAGVVRGMIYRPYTDLVIIDYQMGPHIFYMTTFRSYNDDGTLSYTNTLDLFNNTFPGVAFDQAGLPYVIFQDATMHQLDMFGAIVHSYEIGDWVIFPEMVIDEVGNFHIATHSGYSGDFPVTTSSSGYTLLFKFSPPQKRNIIIPSGWSEHNILLEDVSNQSLSLNLNFTTTSITGINATLDNKAYEINWEPPLGEFTGYEIYRQDGEQLTRIGSVASYQTSFTHYTEVALKDKPEYVVRVLTKDGENESKPHSPAVLTAKAETGGKVDLNWQPYTGYENATYTIYRGVDEYSMEPVASLKNDQFTFSDKLPASGEYLYRLEIKGEEGISRSNTVAVSSEISEQEVALWPNPVIDVVHCRWEGRSRTNTLELTDLQGRLVAEMHNVDPSGYELKRGNTPAGIYLLTFEDAAGKTTERLVFR